MNSPSITSGRITMSRYSYVGLRLLAYLAFACALPGYAMAETVINDIAFTALPGDQVQIRVKADGKLPKPQTFNTDNPPRLAVDFSGVKSQLPKQAKNVGIGLARSIRTLESGGRTRVVINLDAAAAAKINTSGNEAIITIAGGSNNAIASASSRENNPGKKSPKGGSQIKKVDFRRGPDGSGRIILSLSDPKAVVDLRQQGSDVIVDVANTRLPPRLMRILDVTDFATPVQTIKAAPNGLNTQITITGAGQFEHLAYQADREYVVELKKLSQRELDQIAARDKVYNGDRLSLNFQDIEVRSVLQLLADFTGMNLVVSDTVSGNITLRLQNVPWDHALDIILKARGLAMRQKDNVVMIAPAEEIAAREKLELESQMQIQEIEPLRTEWYRLNFAKADDVAAILTGGTVKTSTGSDVSKSDGSKSKSTVDRSEENSLLSARGSITKDPRTNTLLIKDTETNLAMIREAIRKLDIPVRQVLIESRIVNANDSFSKDLGVKFGFGGKTNFDNGDTQAYLGGGLEGDMDTSAVAGPFVVTGSSSNENLMVNLPAASATSALNFVVGTVASNILRLELSAMQSEGRGEIVSSPRVVTADQHKATIKQGIEIPYEESTSSGATNIEFKEAVLKLEVTPQITPDDSIIMDLSISKDNPDYSRLVGNSNTPPIDTRSVDTQVLVNNGETVVLGGIFESTKTVTKNQVPVLGDMPYLGNLFREKLVTDENRELLIFVTPKVIKENLGRVSSRGSYGK